MESGMKAWVLALIGTVGGYCAALFGGWDASLQTLLIFMVIDYVMGLAVAGVFHKSQKTETGTLSSKECFEGLARKGAALLIVLVGAQLDRVSGIDYVRDGVCIAFIANETISIIENAGLMGVPIPDVLTKAIELLKKQSDQMEGEGQ